MACNNETTSLQHHGVKGMKWGVRRYQNKDGSLTALGEKRMGIKPGVDKKLREDLKDRRAARRISLQKNRQDTLDRISARSIEKAKLKLAQKKAQEDTVEQEANRKLTRAKLKQDARDRAADRKLMKQKLDTEKENSKKNLPEEDYYELPDTLDRQSISSASGKKLAAGALAVVGTVAAVAAAKKYGPAIMNVLRKRTRNSEDIATEIFNEASRYRGQTTALVLSDAMSSVGNIPLLAAPERT